jgi:hypothetical protein
MQNVNNLKGKVNALKVLVDGLHFLFICQHKSSSNICEIDDYACWGLATLKTHLFLILGAKAPLGLVRVIKYFTKKF